MTDKPEAMISTVVPPQALLHENEQFCLSVMVARLDLELWSVLVPNIYDSMKAN